MANENQQPPLKSYCKKIKDFDFSNEIIIDRLTASPDAVKFHFDRMKKTFPQYTESQIWQKVNHIIIRDNIFNAAMQLIVPCYEMHIDDEELTKLALWLKNNNPSLEKAPEDILKKIGQRMVEKQLVFDDLQQLWNINVTDKEVIDMLHKMYLETNQPIRDIVNDPKRINALKPTLLEQKLVDEIIKHLKYRLDEEAIQRNAEEQNRKNQEFLKTQQEQKAKEEANKENK